MQVEKYAIRKGSGGNRLHKGGDGIISLSHSRSYEHFSLLTKRRTKHPMDLIEGR